MTRKTRSYSELRLQRLADPEVAAQYLNVTMENSPDNFLAALKNVAQARQIAKVAKEAGVQRETLYRSLSNQGNPTLDTLSSVLSALGLKLAVRVEGASTIPQPTPVSRVSREEAKKTANPETLNLLGSRENSWITVGMTNNFVPQATLEGASA